MSGFANPRDCISIPSDWNVTWQSNDIVAISLDSISGVNLAQIKLKDGMNPTYNYSSSVVSKYEIAGYTMSYGGSEIRFSPTHVVTEVDFADESSLMVYVAWNPEYILEFYSDQSHYKPGEVSGSMAARKLSSTNYKVPQCTFIPPSGTCKKFTYFNDVASPRRW